MKSPPLNENKLLYKGHYNEISYEKSTLGQNKTFGEEKIFLYETFLNFFIQQFCFLERKIP